MKCSLVFTAYDRVDYFAQTMASWSQVRGFHDWVPVVFLEPSTKADRMEAIAKNAGARVVRNDRQRKQSNPWDAFNFGFEELGQDFVVLAEDDIVVAADILEYFHWIADTYAGTGIFSATAYSRNTDVHPIDYGRVLKAQQFSGLVWGTWSDVWAADMKNTWDHDYSSGQSTGTPTGWDWNLNLRIRGDRHCIHPRLSRSDHIGEYGEHVSPANFHVTRAGDFIPDMGPVEYYE